MPLAHVVRLGEHVPMLAARHGFADFRTVWDHPDNAALRGARSPTMLVPGDVVAIPDRAPRTELRPTGGRHFFEARRSPLRLRLRVLDPFGAPIPDGERDLSAEGGAPAVHEGGVTSVEIPPDARRATLSLRERGVELAVHVGELQPSDTASGLHARLHQLGYLAALPAEGEEIDPDDRRLAVELFQRDHALAVTGLVTPALREAVRAAHGV